MTPRCYEDIKALARSRGCNIPDLIVLARNNDPFFCGTLAHRRDAEWFVWRWNKLGYTGRTGVHLRAIHYRLVSQDPPHMMPDGSPPEHPGMLVLSWRSFQDRAALTDGGRGSI
jgi:hypothetical protein